ncbi:hypothetical protein [Amycolatopsis sp. NPDC004625]|uniref:hypothetical protein n=1 Tax=Amycolatopsis sp. NPDC004625 TaxID=3154670 RepID=UPI0033BB1653
MNGRPTWGSAAVTGLAGFATGLLVAALLVAGRPAPRTAETTDTTPTTTVSAVPVTVTGSPPPAPTVLSVVTVPPTTTTSVVEVTVPPSTTSTSGTPTSASPVLPLTSGWRD